MAGAVGSDPLAAAALATLRSASVDMTRIVSVQGAPAAPRSASIRRAAIRS